MKHRKGRNKGNIPYHYGNKGLLYFFSIFEFCIDLYICLKIGGKQHALLDPIIAYIYIGGRFLSSARTPRRTPAAKEEGAELLQVIHAYITRPAIVLCCT